MSDLIPYYTLNGLRTVRHVYRKPVLPGGFDDSVCDEPLCRTTTRASYCLVDNGDVYFTSPAGVIFYVGWNQTAASRIYPVNGIITMESTPPELGNVSAQATGPRTIIVNLPPNNQEGINYERYINPSPIRQVEWSPGIATCDAFKIGEDIDQIPAYILPEYDYWRNPKTPDRMELPFGNGYYVVQDGRSKAIVFYNGEVIYNGPYNGSGVACEFAYGLDYCISDDLCCPVQAEATWELKTYQKWARKGDKWKTRSLFQKAIEDMNVDRDGRVTSGNVISSTADPKEENSESSENQDGQQNNNEQPTIPTITILPYIVDDTSKIPVVDEHGQDTGKIYCACYRTDKTYLGTIVVVDSTAVIVDRTLSKEEQEEGERVKKREADLLAEIDTVMGEIAVIQAEVAQKMFEAQAAKEAYQRTPTEANKKTMEETQRAYELANNQMDAKQTYKSMLEKKHNEDISVNYEKYISSITVGDREFNEIKNKRILWSFHNSAAWAKPYDVEKFGFVVMDCDYETEYILKETVQRKECETGAAAIHHKTWYEGSGLDVSASNSRFMISKWMEECCKECMSSSENNKCSEYKCGGGCNCTAPENCGKECYPIQNEQEPVWKHVVPNTCVLDEQTQQLIARVSKNAGWCDDTQNVTWGEEVSIGHLRIPMQTAQFYGCEKDEEGSVTLNREVSKVCRAEIGQAKIDQLGGRIHLIYGSLDSDGNKQLTNWAYIHSETQGCRHTKNYSIMGELTNKAALPGMKTPNEEDISKSELDYEAVHHVVLRAPHESQNDDDWGFTTDDPLDNDPEEIKTSLVRFYPAYLTCPGYERDTTRLDVNNPKYHLHETWIKGEDGKNACLPYPNPGYFSDPDGYNWTFCGYKFEYADGTNSEDGEPQEGDTPKVPVRICGVWSAEEIVPSAERDARFEYEMRVGHSYYTEDEQEKPDEQQEEGEGGDEGEEEAPVTEKVVVRREIPFPEPIDGDTWEFLCWGDNREWCIENLKKIPKENKLPYCITPTEIDSEYKRLTKEIKALQGQLDGATPERKAEINRQIQELEEAMTKLTLPSPDGGICYAAKLHSWGDKDGAPIRMGTQVGDIYRYKEPITDDKTPEEVEDKYWMWNGTAWVDGAVQFADIPGDITIFYKASGVLDLSGSDREGFECTVPKAIFKGKRGSLQACGDLLAVNLNMDSSYHKVLFGVVQNPETGTSSCETIWDMPANHTEYKDKGGNKMKEGMVCAGDTYVFVVYNTADNRQTFRLWMQEYSGPDGVTTHDNPVGLNTYTGDFTYGEVPDIFSVKPSFVNKQLIKKYGNDVQRRYALLKSRNGKKLYVFYNGELVRTYNDSTASSESGTIAGPKYAVIARKRNNSRVYDIWYEGTLAKEGVPCEPQFNGALVSCVRLHERGGSSSGYDTFEIYTYDTFVVGGAVDHLYWANISIGRNWTDYETYNASMYRLATVGDWVYYLFADASGSLCGPVEILPNFSGTLTAKAAWKIFRWNASTEALEQVSNIKGSVDSLVKFPSQLGVSNHNATPDEADYSTKKRVNISNYGSGPSQSFYVEIDNFIPSDYTNANGGRQLASIAASVVDQEDPAKTATVTGWFYIYTHDNGWAGVQTTPTRSMFAFIFRSNGLSSSDQSVEIVDWSSFGRQWACHRSGGVNWSGSSYEYSYTACLPSNVEAAIARKDEGSAVRVTLDGYTLTESTIDCDCAAVETCGNYTGFRENNTFKIFYKNYLLNESQRWTWCCHTGTRGGDWALFPNGHLYWHNVLIGNNWAGAVNIGCCGDGLLVRDADNEVYFLVYDAFNGELASPIPISKELSNYSMSCCGVDYYLIQHGSFTKEGGCGVQYTTTTTTEEEEHSGIQDEIDPDTGEIHEGIEARTITVTHIYQKIVRDENDSYQGELENGDFLSLEETKVYEGRTKINEQNGTQTVYHYERPYKWKLVTQDRYDNETTIYIDHDTSYSFIKEGAYVISDEMKEERGSYIPWKTTYSHDRDVHVFYKDTEISTDPRITALTCFRYKNIFEAGVNDYRMTPEYHAHAAYAVFYDDPYHQQVKYESREWVSGQDDALSTKTFNEEYVTTYSAVQNPVAMKKYSEKALDLDVDWSKPCDCEQIALYRNTYANVCLIVFEEALCTSQLSHANDKPLVPFVDTFYGEETEADVLDWRSQVIYINDLNTPVRWDRFTNADPPDAWTRNYMRDAAGTGGLWLAAPTYNDERSETNNLFDKSGRLVAAGNNTVYVWDEEHGRLVFDVVTGRKVDYGKQDG